MEKRRREKREEGKKEGRKERRKVLWLPRRLASLLKSGRRQAGRKERN